MLIPAPYNKIRTPRTCPTSWSPEWRHDIASYVAQYETQLAEYVAADGSVDFDAMRRGDVFAVRVAPTRPPDLLFDEMRASRFISTLVGYLRLENRNPTAAARMYPNVHLAYSIYSGTYPDRDAKDCLEALLLTSEPYSVIAVDMHLPLDCVRHYERLFFNCRSAEGTLVRSSYALSHLAFGHDYERLISDFARTFEERRQRTALPGKGGELAPKSLYRLVAMSYGYPALTLMLGWANPAGGAPDAAHLEKIIMQQVRRICAKRALREELGQETMVALMAQFTLAEVLPKLEKQLKAGKEGGAGDILYSILSSYRLSKPKSGVQALVDAQSGADPAEIHKNIDMELASRLQLPSSAGK